MLIYRLSTEQFGTLKIRNQYRYFWCLTQTLFHSVELFATWIICKERKFVIERIKWEMIEKWSWESKKGWDPGYTWKDYPQTYNVWLHFLICNGKNIMVREPLWVFIFPPSLKVPMLQAPFSSSFFYSVKSLKIQSFLS